MSDKLYQVPAEWAKRAHVDAAKYREMYERSIKDPNGFWAEQATRRGSVHAWLPFALAFLAELVMAYVLAGMVGHLGTVTIRSAVISGLFVWAGFMLTTMLVNNAFAGRRYTLTAIDAGHWLLVVIVMGVVIGWIGV